MNAQYHQSREEGGYIITFLHHDQLTLHEEFDHDIIGRIDQYFEKLDRFDWAEALAILKSRK